MKWKGHQRTQFEEWTNKATKEELQEHVIEKKYPTGIKAFTQGALVILVAIAIYGCLVFGSLYAFETIELKEKVESRNEFIISIADDLCGGNENRLNIYPNSKMIQCINQSYKFQDGGNIIKGVSG